jgi:flagella basal body P-ring formation protein FlgA
MNATSVLLSLAASTGIDVERVEWNLPPHLAVVSARTTEPIAVDHAVAEWSAAPRAGSQSVRLRVKGKAVFAFVELAELSPVWVAARPIPRDAVIGADDVHREPRAAIGLSASPIGARAKAEIAAGETLVEGRVDLPPPIPRGAPVTLVSGGSALRVSAPGRLFESCRIGALCRATSAYGNRIVRGRLATPEIFALETP